MTMAYMLSRPFKKSSKSSKTRPLFNLQLDLTYCCNLSCKHCYQRYSKYNGMALSSEEWIGILGQYAKLARMLDVMPALTLSGGEPLLCAYLWELVKHAREKCSIENIYLLTNGTLLNEEACKCLKQYAVSVQLSIEGPTAEDNDRIRGERSFRKIMSAAVLLHSLGIPYTYQMVLKKGVEDKIEGVFKLAKDSGADAMNFVRFIPARSAKGYDTSEMLESRELQEILKRVLSLSRKYGIPTNTHQPLWCLLEDDIGHPSSAGFLGMTIDPTGGIHVTSRTDNVIGTARDKKGLLGAYFNNDIMKRLRKGDIDGCRECDYFKRCRGDRSVSYILNGDFFGPDIHCWHWQEDMR